MSRQSRLLRSALTWCLFATALSWTAAAAPRALAQTPAVPVIDTVASGDQSLTVAWTAPAGVTGITAYDVRHILSSASAADKSDAAQWTTLDGAWAEGRLAVIVTGLANGSSYDVQVRAVTSSDGGWSATRTGTPRDPGARRVTSSATPFVNQLPLQGVLSDAADVDVFSFAITGGAKEYIVWADGSTDTEAQLFSGRTGSRITSRITSVGDSGRVKGPRGFLLAGYELAAGTYWLQVTGRHDDSVGAYTVHLQIEADTKATSSDATEIGINSVTSAVLGRYSDHSFGGGDRDKDYFKFVLSAQTTITARAAGFPTDTVGRILNASFTEVASNDDSYLWGATRQFAMRATLDAGTYYIEVRPFVSATFHFPTTTGPYWLHVYESPDPGASRSAAAGIDFSTTAGGDIETAGDVQYFEFTLAEATRVVAVGASTEFRIYAEIQDSGGSTVNSQIYTQRFSDRNGARLADSFEIAQSLSAGTYYLKVEAHADTTLDTGEYLVVLWSDARFERMRDECPSPPSGISDPLFGCQWPLDNNGQLRATTGEDINLGTIWNTNTGAGVNVAVVDSGLDFLHEDLTDNVDRSKNHSYCGNSDVRTDAPTGHGTQVAGLIAARDNSVGIRGVASRATLHAHQLLCESFTVTIDIADSASRSRATTSVSNNSWGPRDGPRPSRSSSLWEAAVDAGLREGDGGKGVVYVFAAGNGDLDADYSNLNEYASYYGVVAVCAVGPHGKRALYSERGPNLWVCAPSSGESATRPGVATTDHYNRYMDDFGGTSAATPVVSGVASLVRAAESTLTWRDVKLILAGSARKNDSGDFGWEAGALKYGSTTDRYHYSNEYGFGVVDATAAVGLAGTWVKLPEQRVAEASYGTSRNTSSAVTSEVTLAGSLDFVEFVEVRADFDAARFRDLTIELVSPLGAVSVLTEQNTAGCSSSRPCSLKGEFRFGAALHLGEDPRGVWGLRVRDRLGGRRDNVLRSWTLKVYGHRQAPDVPRLSYLRPGTGQLTVAWSEPAYTGLGGVTGYDVRHIDSVASDRSDSAWTVIASSCTASACTAAITGLSDGARRDVQVRAKSSRSSAWTPAVRGVAGAANSQPFFVDGPRAVRVVAEGAGVGADVGEPLEATDYESVSSSETLTYALSGDDAALFALDASTGQITTRFDPDYEGRSSYAVTVSVYDAKDDAGVSELPSAVIDDVVTVAVEVGDVDEPPTIARCVMVGGDEVCSVLTGTDRVAYEEGGAGDVTEYRFDDPEGASVVAGLTGTDAGAFSLTSDGVLSLREVPDHEDPRDDDRDGVYELSVELNDASNTATLDVEVEITDKNEAPQIERCPLVMGVTACTAALTSATERFTFAENGSGVVVEYRAPDPESGRIAWILTGNDRADFSIVDGALSFASPPDHEMPADANRNNVYEVSVVASDTGGLSDTVAVTVTVEDVNEPAGITGDATANFPENGTGAVGTYAANDPEERESVTWTLSGADASSFEISATSGGGVLRFADPPDHEARERYSVTLEASDRKDAAGQAVGITDPDIDDTFAVTVNVTDQPEAPSITTAPAAGRISVAEGRTGAVFTYAATDPEGSDITWALTGADRLDLRIGSATGVVEFEATPDFENAADSNRDNSYIVTVEASDGDKKATQRLTVTVTNVEEAGSLSFSSSQPQDGTRFTATLSDPDGVTATTGWAWERSQNQVTWSSISGATGSTYTPTVGDQNYYLRATATYRDRQGGTAARTARAVSAKAVRLNPDVNHPPEFPSAETGRREIDENSSAGTNIGAPVAAADADAGDQDDLVYSLRTADARLFDIVAGSGQLRAKSGVTLDHESRSSYSVVVTVRDPSGATDTQSVTITLSDVDEPPVVTGSVAPSFAEHRPFAATVIETYRAADPERKSVTWAVTGADAASFAIGATGALRFARQPDFDTDAKNSYQITIEADDGANVGELEVTVRVTDTNEAPVVTGAASLTWAENATGTLDFYSAADPERAVTPTWSLGGSDARHFAINISGELSFRAAPDYERRADRNRDNTFNVEVRASDGTNTGTFAVTVTVEDVDEPGRLELSTPSPSVSRTVTAQLTEPDTDVRDRTWRWERSQDRNDPSAWAEIASATGASYRPSPDDVGHWLRATVTYRDTHDNDTDPPKSATTESASAVALNAPVARPSTGGGAVGGGAVGGGAVGGGGGGAVGGSAAGGGGGGGGDLDVGFATFVVANGWSPPDVGAASVLAARTDAAVVTYTDGGELSQATSELMREALPAEVIIVGGLAAVSSDVRAQIRSASPESGLTRITGAGRADTAAAVARRVLGSPSDAGRVTVIIANGWSPPDIGAAAALAARSGRSAVLYTQRDRLPESSAALLRDYQTFRVVLIGGTAAISNEAQASAAAAAGADASISRLTGADRVDTAAQAARRVLGNPAGAPRDVTLVIANGWSPPDVGVAAALAAATPNAAVAYTERATLPAATRALIADYRPTTITIIGGRSAVANDVRDALADAAPDGAAIRRITGNTRTDTAAKAARRILAGP